MMYADIDSLFNGLGIPCLQNCFRTIIWVVEVLPCRVGEVIGRTR